MASPSQSISSTIIQTTADRLFFDKNGNLVVGDIPFSEKRTSNPLAGGGAPISSIIKGDGGKVYAKLKFGAGKTSPKYDITEAYNKIAEETGNEDFLTKKGQFYSLSENVPTPSILEENAKKNEATNDINRKLSSSNLLRFVSSVIPEGMGGEWIKTPEGKSVVQDYMNAVVKSTGYENDPEAANLISGITKKYVEGNGGAVYDPKTGRKIRSVADDSKWLVDAIDNQQKEAKTNGGLLGDDYKKWGDEISSVYEQAGMQPPATLKKIELIDDKEDKNYGKYVDMTTGSVFGDFTTAREKEVAEAKKTGNYNVSTIAEKDSYIYVPDGQGGKKVVNSANLPKEQKQAMGASLVNAKINNAKPGETVTTDQGEYIKNQDGSWSDRTGQVVAHPSGIIAKVGQYDVYGSYPVDSYLGENVQQYFYMPNTGDGTVDPIDEIMRTGGTSVGVSTKTQPATTQGGTTNSGNVLTDLLGGGTGTSQFQGTDYEQLLNQRAGGNALLDALYQTFQPEGQFELDVYNQLKGIDLQRAYEDYNKNTAYQNKLFQQNYDPNMERAAASLAATGSLMSGGGSEALTQTSQEMIDPYLQSLEQLTTGRDRTVQDITNDQILKQMELQKWIIQQSEQEYQKRLGIENDLVNAARDEWMQEWTEASYAYNQDPAKNQPPRSFEQFLSQTPYGQQIQQVQSENEIVKNQIGQVTSQVEQQQQQVTGQAPIQSTTINGMPYSPYPTTPPKQPATTPPENYVGGSKYFNEQTGQMEGTATPQRQSINGPTSNPMQGTQQIQGTTINGPTSNPTKGTNQIQGTTINGPSSIPQSSPYTNIGDGYQFGQLSSKPQQTLFQYYLPQNWLQTESERSKALQPLIDQPYTTNKTTTPIAAGNFNPNYLNR